MLHSAPANTRRWTNVGLLLGQRRRRWPNSKPALGRSIVLRANFVHRLCSQAHPSFTLSSDTTWIHTAAARCLTDRKPTTMMTCTGASLGTPSVLALHVTTCATSCLRIWRETCAMLRLLWWWHPVYQDTSEIRIYEGACWKDILMIYTINRLLLHETKKKDL